MTRHVLVTGGAGFIGSHVADAYLARGWRVSVIDDLSTGSRENLDPRAELHVADLRDPRTAELVVQLKPELVSHHAAQMDVRRSVSEPAFDAEVNIVAAVRLLQAAVDAGVKQFLFASSGGAIYGEPQQPKQTEEHPAVPLSPYGCAKLSFEHYLQSFGIVQGLSWTALRYANVYGPRQNTRGEAGVVAIFISRMLAGEPVTINGSGLQTRDFVYVADVVKANLAATDGKLPGVVNVGTGIETSINQLYTLIARALGVSGEAQHGPAKIGEQMRSVLDAAKLEREGGVVPRELEAGLEETVAWFREQRAR